VSALAERVYLDSYLQPLSHWLAQAEVTDIFINRPGEVWIEQLGGECTRHPAPLLTPSALERLSRQVAAANAQGINREQPLLAGTLPDGSRIQIVLPPATRGEVAIAIRRHIAAGRSLKDYTADGSFAAVKVTSGKEVSRPAPGKLAGDGTEALLRTAVLERRNVLISGGTSSGKTTLLNALIAEIPPKERLIAIEDTAELALHHENAVGLLAARGQMGEARVDMEDLLIAALRMRPDRIILGELRGREALTFLRAVNTGHSGSLTTIHADSPERALDQLALLVLQAGIGLSWDDAQRYIRRSLDLVVQLSRKDGQRVIESAMVLGA
jgi:type IV secretion system protein VirB11